MTLRPEYKPFEVTGAVYNLQRFQTVAASSDALENPVVCHLSLYTDPKQAAANETYAVPLSQFLLNKVTPAPLHLLPTDIAWTRSSLPSKVQPRKGAVFQFLFAAYSFAE